LRKRNRRLVTARKSACECGAPSSHRRNCSGWTASDGHTDDRGNHALGKWFCGLHGIEQSGELVEDRDSDLLKTMAVMATRVERKGKLRTEPQAV
jgi:hypothetical protein